MLGFEERIKKLLPRELAELYKPLTRVLNRPIYLYELTRAIENVWRGLGLLFSLAAIVLRSGIGMMIIGRTGSGKSLLIDLAQRIRWVDRELIVIDLDNLTLTALSDKLSYVRDATIYFFLADINNMTPWSLKLLNSVVAQIITDGKYKHLSQGVTIDVEACQAAAILGVQPSRVNDLLSSETYNALGRERFIPIIFLNPLKEGQPVIPPLGKLGLSKDDYYFLIKPVRKPVLPSPDDIKTLAEKVFYGLMSPERSEMHARSLLISYAELTGREPNAKDFLRLYRPYLTLNLFAKRSSPASPLELDEDALELLSYLGQGRYTVKEIMRILGLKSPSSVYRYLTPLQLMRFVSAEKIAMRKNGRVRRKTVYGLSNQLRKFFQTVDKRLELLKTNGVTNHDFEVEIPED